MADGAAAVTSCEFPPACLVRAVSAWQDHLAARRARTWRHHSVRQIRLATESAGRRGSVTRSSATCAVGGRVRRCRHGRGPRRTAAFLRLLYPLDELATRFWNESFLSAV